ncbi:C-type mannose receptor 2-like [Antedon mediterranea]|uniref:C-type mannose receptor 2-like n=1 Tax=Antedon mediterranea TaxID=105859 RepID=UPI003AF62A5E
MMFVALVAVMVEVTLPALALYHPGRSCCPSYWTSYNNNCYRIFGESLNWQDAENYCQHQGSDAHLVSLHSQGESDFVKDFWNTATGNRVTERVWRNMYWIGLTDAHYEGHFKWSDGSGYASYRNFHAGEPNNHRGNQDCIVVWDYQHKNKGLWDDQQCYNKHPFICKMSSLPNFLSNTSGNFVISQALALASSCTKSSLIVMRFSFSESTSPRMGEQFSFNMQKHVLIFGQSVTWQDAENYCQHQGSDAHLVSLHSQGESDFVKDLWNTATGNRVTERVWRNMYWIGLTDAHYEGHFKWSDGSGYASYRNFHAGEPNNHRGNQDCIVVWDYQHKNKGLWDDQQCYNKHPFICKMCQ